MVSDAELALKIHDFLRNSDLKKTSNNFVIKKLECDYGLDFSSKKPFFRDQVTLFLQAHYEVYAEQEQEDDGSCPEDDVTYPEDANDDVSYTDYHEVDDHDDNDAGSQPLIELPVPPINDDDTSTAINNDYDDNSNEGIFLKGRSDQLHKEKIKRTCMSGKHCTLSPQLQEFLGVPHLTRAEVVKHLWAYVKGKNLQDPQDGKNIICDDTLRDLLGVDSINILQISKALTKHIWPSAKPVQREKPVKQERDEEPCGDEMQGKRQKKVLSGFLAPLPMSETLTEFLGTGETALTRADVIRRVWQYIKAKNLQDPNDKKMVICDEKLKGLVNVDSFTGFMVSKLLSPHLNMRR